MQIAAYLAQYGKTAVLGEPSLLFILSKYREGEVSFQYKNIDFYTATPLSSLLQEGYAYVVLDIGAPLAFQNDRTPKLRIPQETMDSLLIADMRVCVADYSPWNKLSVHHMLSAEYWGKLLERSAIVLSCRIQPDIPGLLQKQYNRDFAVLPIAEPFALSEEIRGFFDTLLQNLLAS